MNYNFVFFATTFDWYKFMYKDLLQRKDVQFFEDFSELLNPIEKKLYRIHFSKKVNRIVRLPFKNIWFHKAIQRIEFETEKPICFIWFSHYMHEIERGFVSIVKEELPDSKHVFYFTDAKNITEKNLAVLRPIMDRIGVFDPICAEKNNLEFWPNLYPDTEQKESEILYDICFIGKDRGRQEKLEEIARACDARGIKTAFYLLTDHDKNSVGSIHYIDRLIPYEEALSLVRSSKCVLELQIERVKSCSLRVQEAIILGKKLLTDNVNVKKMPCCEKSGNVTYFSEVSEIPWEDVLDTEPVDYGYKGEFSGNEFLKNISNF